MKQGLAAALLVALLAAVAVALRFRAALTLSLALAFPGLEAWRAPLAGAVTREPVAIALAERALAADLYVPARASGSLLLVHGLSAAGRRQPDLARLARLLAEHGQLVLVPEFRGLTEFRLDGHEVAEIRAALGELRRRAAPAGLSLALAGFSFGAGPALLAAAAEADLRLVGSFGGYADLANVAAFVTTGVHHFAGRRHAQPQEEYNRWKLLRLLVPLVADVRDRTTLDAVASRRLANPGDDTRALEAAVSADGRAVLSLVLNRREEAVADLLQRLGSRSRAALAALSPLAAIARIRARLLIVHGAGDPSIPFTESLRLAEAAGGRARLVVLETFHHTGPTRGLWFVLPAARDGWRLLRVVDDLLGSARPADDLSLEPSAQTTRLQGLDHFVYTGGQLGRGPYLA